jgi:hypothetical protein
MTNKQMPIAEAQPITKIKENSLDALYIENMLGELTESDVFLDEDTKKLLIDIQKSNQKKYDSKKP